MTTSAAKTAPDESEIARVAVKLFFAISEEWDLTEEERLILTGVSSRTTLHTWRRKVQDSDKIRLSNDTLERLSYIAGIYKGIQLLFNDPLQWKKWIRKPNRDFFDASPLEKMLRGRVVDLADVRRYIDAWRGAQHV